MVTMVTESGEIITGTSPLGCARQLYGNYTYVQCTGLGTFQVFKSQDNRFVAELYVADEVV